MEREKFLGWAVHDTGGGLMAHYLGDEFWRGRCWPYGGWIVPYRPFWVTHSRTDTSDMLQIRMDRRVRKEDIKVRFVEPDRIEVEVQRRPPGDEIPVKEG